MFAVTACRVRLESELNRAGHATTHLNMLYKSASSGQCQNQPGFWLASADTKNERRLYGRRYISSPLQVSVGAACAVLVVMSAPMTLLTGHF